MKSLALLLVLLLLAALSVNATDQIKREKIKSEGKDRSYYIFLPPSLKPDKPVPLLIVLHGSNRNGLSLVEKWKELADTEGFIVVGPDSSDSSGWRVPQDGPEFIYDLAEMLIKKYPVAADRIYLFGHSAGAVFALNLAMLESEYFAAVAFHAGSWRSDRELKTVEVAARKTPIKIIVGDRDAFFPLDSVKRTEATLKGNGFDVAVSVMKNHDHWYYDLAPDINRDAWQFLQKNALPSTRRHVARVFNSSAGNLNEKTKAMNVLRVRANELIQRFYTFEQELGGKDPEKDKSLISEVAKKQVELLTEAAKALRDTAAEAEEASQMNVPGNYKEYFVMLARAAIMRAESAESLKTRSELLLSTEDSNAIVIKRNELNRKSVELTAAAEALESRARQLIQ